MDLRESLRGSLPRGGPPHLTTLSSHPKSARARMRAASAISVRRSGSRISLPTAAPISEGVEETTSPGARPSSIGASASTAPLTDVDTTGTPDAGASNMALLMPSACEVTTMWSRQGKDVSDVFAQSQEPHAVGECQLAGQPLERPALGTFTRHDTVWGRIAELDRPQEHVDALLGNEARQRAHYRRVRGDAESVAELSGGETQRRRRRSVVDRDHTTRIGAGEVLEYLAAHRLGIRHHEVYQATERESMKHASTRSVGAPPYHADNPCHACETSRERTDPGLLEAGQDERAAPPTPEPGQRAEPHRGSDSWPPI